MNLLSGLEKFGLDQMDTDHLFEEEKSDTPKESSENSSFGCASQIIRESTTWLP